MKTKRAAALERPGSHQTDSVTCSTRSSQTCCGCLWSHPSDSIVCIFSNVICIKNKRFYCKDGCRGFSSSLTQGSKTLVFSSSVNRSWLICSRRRRVSRRRRWTTAAEEGEEEEEEEEEEALKAELQPWNRFHSLDIMTKEKSQSV